MAPIFLRKIGEKRQKQQEHPTVPATLAVLVGLHHDLFGELNYLVIWIHKT